MLADDQATEMVVFGENGLLQGLPKGSIHISSSTISVELSRRTWKAHEEQHQRYIAVTIDQIEIGRRQRISLTYFQPIGRKRQQLGTLSRC